MSSQVVNNLRNELYYLNDFHNSIPKTRANKSMVRERINTCLNQAHTALVQASASTPITPEDRELLQLFKDELRAIDKNISKLSTKRINRQADKIIHSEGEKAIFSTTAGLKDKIGFLMDSLKGFLVGKIRQRVNRYIYFSWNQKVRYNQRMEKIVKLNDEISKLEAKYTRKPSTKLGLKIARKKSIVDGKESYVAEFQRNLQIADTARRDLIALGGVRTSIKTKDHVEIDSLYLSADKFREACTAAGAVQAKIQFTKDGETSPEIFALRVDATEGRGEEFINTLNRLNIFKNFNLDSPTKDGGWAKVRGPDNNFYIVPDFEVAELLKVGYLQDVAGVSTLEGCGLIAQDLVAGPLRNPGTIILGIGASGVYEMYKREAMALLMQGMNVMLYNPRGHGDSAGKPSEKGFYEDIEAVYQYLKTAHQVEDEKIVVRGLCLSGGAAVELAAKHPHINLILDQTYADFKDIALDAVLDTLKDRIHFKPQETNIVKRAIVAGLKPILRGVVGAMTPDYTTTKRLRKLEGKLLILRSSDDMLIPKSMTDKIIDAYASKAPYEKMRDQLRLGVIQGSHGDSWLDTDESGVGHGRYHMLSFLHELGMTNSIDGGTALHHLSGQYDQYLQNLPSSIPLELTPPADGAQRFAAVLEDLARFRDRLGGVPNFPDGEPVMNAEDSQAKFFGFPKSHIQDYLRMAINNHRRTRFFWRTAGRLFDVNPQAEQSRYEDIHFRIQRFGMLIANKERFKKILDQQMADHYSQFSDITGMAWHINDNGAAAEANFIDLVESFLTEHYEAARAQGDEALFEFFQAITGACFEDRVRNLEAYILSHQPEEAAAAFNAADWNTNESVDHAFDAELGVLTTELRAQHNDPTYEPTAAEILQRVQEKGIFNYEFAVEGGASSRPTLQTFYNWILNLVDVMYVMAPVTTEELVQFQVDILRQECVEVNADNVMARLQAWDGQNEGFEAASEETRAIVQRILEA